MIDFRLVAERIEYQGCDTLMFTSKQAVVSAEAIDPTWKDRPTIAIGEATAGQIERFGGRVLYHPKHFYGQTLAEDILKHFQARRVLYLRPRTVSFDSRTFLAQAGYNLHEQIIYETFCRPYTPQDAPPHGSIIIFTSPSTIHCFLDHFEWHPTYTAIVIGTATLEHLPDGCDYHVAQTPLIDACITKALETRDLATT
jgi:uroporphyrinogen-III synthase